MAAPILIPDVARNRVENSPSARVTNSRPQQEGASFERVRKDVSGAPGKPELERPNGRPGKGAMGEGKARAESGSEEAIPQGEPGKDHMTSSTAEHPVEPAITGEIASGDKEAEEAIVALFMPLAEPGAGGKPLPGTSGESGSSPAITGLVSSGKGQNGPLNMRQLFMQVVQGEGEGKAGEASLEAGKGLSDLQSFKASLAEAVDGRSGRISDSASPTLMTSQRGLEVREGSALIRQYSTTVETPVQQGDWGDKMAGKISWLASQRISSAEIHINPPDMGPVDVRVSVQNDQASITVHSQNSSVRDLLELNSHRLRDMLQDNGLSLAKMDVSDQSSRQQHTAGGESGQSGQGEAGASDTDESGQVSREGETVSTGETHVHWESQVDTYA